MAFSLAGLATLLFEVVTLRTLRLFWGSTSRAVAAVLVAFLGGMGVGNLWAGRKAERVKSSLRLAAVAQVMAACLFVIVPALLRGLGVFERWLAVRATPAAIVTSVSFLLPVLMIAVACVGLGMVLPLVARSFIGSVARSGQDVGLLYAVNAVSGALGALLAGFVLLPCWGLQQTLAGACLIALGAGLLFWGLGVSSAKLESESEAPGSTAPPLSAEPAAVKPQGERQCLFWVLVSYGLAGAASTVYEVGWTRAIGAVLGSSVYSFSLMLVVFIAGLALGGWWGGQMAGRLSKPVTVLSTVEVGVGLAALAVLPLLSRMTGLIPAMIAKFGVSFWPLLMLELVLIFLVLLLPALLMGMAFPLATRSIMTAGVLPGRAVGLTAGINTIGSVLGISVAATVLLPVLGLSKTLVLTSALNLICGVILVTAAESGRIVLVRTVAMALLWVAAAALASHVFPSPGKLSPVVAALNPSHAVLESRILYHKDGPVSGVTVMETVRGERVILLDGKPDASSGADLPTQIMAAHLPLTLHPEPRRALVIGLASGITLGSAGRHALETLDCVEIEPAMLEACRYFDSFNYRILEDPRVRVVIEDGRRYLAVTPQRYDVIVSEPSNPWIAGMGDLFTREFFELCRSRLERDGILCVWLEAYTLDLECFCSVVRSFGSVFTHVTMWNPKPFDYLLLGSQAPPCITSSALAARLSDPRISNDLARIGVRTVADFLSSFVLGGDNFSLLGGNARLHTDDNALLEFYAPRSMFRCEAAFEILERAEVLRLPDFSFIRITHDGGETLVREAVTQVFARGRVVQSLLWAHRGRNLQAEVELKKAAELNREDSFLQRILRERLRIAALVLRRGDPQAAEQLYWQVLSILPDDADACYGLGFIAEAKGDPEQASVWYERAVKKEPTRVALHTALAAVRQKQGRLAEAIQHYQTALALCPDSVPLRNNLAWLRATAESPQLRDREVAVKLASEACELTGWKDIRMITTLADIYMLGGQPEHAAAVFERALRANETGGDKELIARLRAKLRECQLSNERLRTK